ncbi:MAG TPA: hypothetical protein VF933_31815 [Streptosporangiaceae bacterium]
MTASSGEVCGSAGRHDAVRFGAWPGPLAGDTGNVPCEQLVDSPRAVLGLDLGAAFGSPAPHPLVSGGRQMTGAGPAPNWWTIRAQRAGRRPAG